MAAVHAAVEANGLCGQLPYYAERSRNHGVEVSRDQLRAVLEDIETTFPDVRMDVIDLVVDDEVVIGRYAVTGTHLGTQRLPFVHGGVLHLVPPTGRRFRTEHAHIFHISNGEIVAHDAVQDNLEMARQLGVPLDPRTTTCATSTPLA